MLNFKDWEKTAEDGKTVTMKHPSGHTMKILVTKLPKIQQEAIKRLKLAKGGKVQNYDDGGDVSQSGDSSDNSQIPAPVAPAANITINAAPAASAPQNPAAIPGPIPAAPPVAPNFNQPPTAVDPITNLGNPNNAALTQDKAAQLSQKAAAGQASVDAQTAQGSIPIAQSQQQNAIDTLNRINASAIDMTKHADDFRNYMQTNKIDPNAFMDNKSGGAKTATALGLILGGIGGKGQNNFALDFLNRNIDRAVDAQKQNADNQKTVWGAYNQVYQNQNVATELAKASMADKVIADSNLLKAKLGTQQADVNHLNVVSDMLDKRYKSIQAAAYKAHQAPSAAPSAPAQQMGPKKSANPETKNGKPAYGEESADTAGYFNLQPDLTPDARTKLTEVENAASGDSPEPRAAADLSEIKREYEDAGMRDNIRRQLPEIMKGLAANITPGGALGRTVGPGAFGTAGAGLGAMVGGVKGAEAGAGLGTAAGNYVGDLYTAARRGMGKLTGGELGADPTERPESRQNEDFDTYYQRLGDLLKPILGESTGAERQKKLDGLVGGINADPKNITEHLKAADELIRSSSKYKYLEDYGMANKR